MDEASPISEEQGGNIPSAGAAAQRKAVPGALVGRNPVAIGISKDEGAPERTIVRWLDDGGSRRLSVMTPPSSRKMFSAGTTPLLMSPDDVFRRYH